MSERKACELVGIGRSSQRYRHKNNEANEGLTARLRELAAEHPRYGYRRMEVLVNREQATPVNHKRIYRLYRKEGLALRKEFLNMGLFRHLWDAQEQVGQWKKNYNEERPHSNLGVSDADGMNRPGITGGSLV